MVSEDELLSAVDAAFEVTGRDHAPWPAPHLHRPPHDDEYSRVTNPGKWRIVGARADAWMRALVELDLATVHPDAPVEWEQPTNTSIIQTRHDLAVPRAPGALPLVVVHTEFGGPEGEGVMLWVGDPAVWVEVIPNCGCDACDRGSQPELDDLDRYLVGIVSGTFRRLSSGNRQITAFDDQGRRATGEFRQGEVKAILEHPAGWNELSGVSWLTGEQAAPLS